MVKGCQRRVFHLKNPESGLFEEAFFLLKSPEPATQNGAREIVAEANRILLGFRGSDRDNRRRGKRTAFLLGALTGAAIVAAALLVIGLIV